MAIELKKNVRLTVLPTKKYKTIRIFTGFSSQLAAETAAKRTLLTSLFRDNFVCVIPLKQPLVRNWQNCMEQALA